MIGSSGWRRTTGTVLRNRIFIPALALEPELPYQHLQRTFHFTGDAGALNQIMQTVLGVAVLDVEHFIHPPIQ